MECIFCHKDSSTSKSIEHIIPESLGNKDYVLPTGYVCDECNHYFAIKVEKELLSQPYFVSMRSRNEILTKKGKLVREKMIFPGELKSCEVEMKMTRNGLTVSLNDMELPELIEAGKIRTMIGLYIPKPEFPNAIMSRFLAKCAYEYFLFIMGEEKYDLCVKELLGSKIDTLKDMLEVLGNRNCSISREITKKFEEIYRGTLKDIINQFDTIKGEFVIVVEGNKNVNQFSNLTIVEHVNLYIKEGFEVKEAIKKVAKDRQLNKNEVYSEYHKRGE